MSTATLDSPALEPRRRAETLRLLARNRLALVALVVLVALVIAAIFGRVLAPYGPNAVDVAARLQGPSVHHWFGTDELGRDVFSRVLVGAAVSLKVGIVAVGISGVVGEPAAAPDSPSDSGDLAREAGGAG